MQAGGRWVARRSKAMTVPLRGRAADGLEAAVDTIQASGRRLLAEVSRVIVGKADVMERVLVDVLAQGNILFEDFPGLAKTVMAATFARASGLDFKRIQLTPDVLPADITGSSVYDQAKSQFHFRPGPIFTNVLLADEINRAPPKTQSAMLEAMAERQVSVEGVTHPIDPPFIVMATQNPIEQEGTYPLPEAQMDRFLMRLSMGYPTKDEEAEIARRRLQRGRDEFDVEQVTDAATIRRVQAAVEPIHVAEPVLEYIARLITVSREHPDVRVGSSPRGTLALVKTGRALAALRGRTFVTPDDIRALAVPVLAHRIILEPEARYDGKSNAAVVEEIVRRMPAPTV
jgi:MoxR-like ATPase